MAILYQKCYTLASREEIIALHCREESPDSRRQGAQCKLGMHLAINVAS